MQGPLLKAMTEAFFVSIVNKCRFHFWFVVCSSIFFACPVGCVDCSSVLLECYMAILFVSLSSFFFFSPVSFFVLLTFMLCASLAVQACSITLDKLLWYSVRLFDRVVICGISALTNYITSAIFCIDVMDDIVDDVCFGTVFSFCYGWDVFCL